MQSKKLENQNESQIKQVTCKLHYGKKKTIINRNTINM